MHQLLHYLDKPHIRAAAIVLAGFLLARIAAFIITRVLGSLVAKTKTDADDEALRILRTPTVATIVLLAINVAGHTLALQDRPRFYLTATLQTLGIVAWSVAGLRLATVLLGLLSRRAGSRDLIQPRTLPVFRMFGKVVVSSLSVYFVFLAWRIDLTAWLASAGIAGIAIGFAAKDTLANLFSGLFIVADAPYTVGDVVVLEGGLRGRVLSIGLRSTRMLTMDGVEITVPNAIIGNGMIVNETGGPSISQRVSIEVEAGYGSDIDLVYETLTGVAEGIDHVRSDRKPEVFFRSFGASGLVHTLHVWIDDPLARDEVLHEMRTRTYKAFERAGIEIPYSKHDVYIKEAPAHLREAS